jgi:hypothetical protein
MMSFVSQASLVQVIACFVFVGLYAVLVVVATRIASRRAPKTLDGVSSSVLGPIGGLFGLTAAFLAASVWQSHGQAVDAANLEARSLSHAWIDAIGLPEPLRTEIRTGIEHYVHAVVDDEWPRMSSMTSADKPDSTPASAYLRTAIHTLVTADTMPTEAMTSTIQALQTAFEARSRRIEITLHRISVVQLASTVALGMLVIAMVAVLHHASLSSQIIAVGLTSFAAALALSTIVVHDDPFSGYMAVTAPDFARIAEYGWPVDAARPP